MNLLVISCSLNPECNSIILAHAAVKALQDLGYEPDVIDLRDHTLPFCDGALAYQDAEGQHIAERIRKADGILMAVPIYNWDVNAAAKNLLELAGLAWKEKIVGFLCSAGGSSSYMAVMPFANSLMLDFRVVIVPRFVYANDTAFAHGKVKNGKVLERVGELAHSLIRFTRSLSQPGPSS